MLAKLVINAHKEIIVKIDIQKIHVLREYSNYAARLTQCIEALDSAEGDVEKAKTYLDNCGYLERSKIPFNMNIPEETPAEWPYILGKVSLYLRLGPAIYRKADYFGMPEVGWPAETLDEIESCFRQFLAGKGYLESNPVENVSIKGFYAATRTLHFEVKKQIATLTDDRRFFIDDLLFEHVHDGRTVRFFNKVPICD